MNLQGVKFAAFSQECGGDTKIPNEQLYAYLEANRENLINESQLGIKQVPESDLGREVRRRSKSDLMWLSRYMLWETMPASNGGLAPFSTNMIDEQYYRPVIDLFVKKDDTKSILEQSEVKKRLLLWPRGGAKALDLKTLIPTPSGFQKMEDLKVGDFVYSESGCPVRILSVSEVFTGHECYEVEFSSGEKVVADEGHLWVTDARKDRENKSRWLKRGSPTPTVKTTKQIVDSLFCRDERNHRVLVAQPIQGETKELLIPPYVLGCWLGDGTSASAQLTCDDLDSQIVEEIRKEGIPVTKSNVKFRWCLNGGEGHPDYRKHKVGFTHQLRSLGILSDKHIPEVYLRASEEQRLSLLQGLMDTDGTISKDGKCYFSNTNKQLAYQTRELIASLGFKPSLSVGKAVLNGRVISDNYLIFFQAYPDRPVFRLQRKKVRLTERKKVSLQNYRTIVSVEKVESRPVKCICVDSPTHQFLVGEGFIPTHNSTTDHCDTVQWILNFPEIRILYFTAAADLAEGFVSECKSHFIIREGNPTLMNLFFPEFCLEEKDMGAMDTFTCPVFAAKKIKRKEPTVYAASVGKTKSGWHYELIKADDAVSDKNTESSDQCDSVSKKLFLAQKLLVPGGYYIDYVGTRYADEDHYGVMLDQNVDGEIVASGQGWVRTDNEVTGVSILIGRACQIKPEVAQQLEKEGRPVTYQEAGEQGCILLLPHIMPYKWLMGVYTEDEKSFEGQLNQNPRPASQVTFDRMLLLKNTIPYAEMPNSGPVSQIWDFAFSKKKGRDYTTGSSLIWGTNQEQEPVGYVQEVVRDRFNHATLAKAVVDLAQKYHPFVIGIEGAGGSQMLETAINWEAKKTGDQQVIDVCAHIDWFPPDNQKDAKKVRMAALYPWLLRGGMKFANYCMTPSLEPIYNEFERCLTSHHHDDIPDCLSQHFRLYAPRAYQAVVNDDQSVFSSNDSSWNLIFEEGCDPFGNIGFGPPTPTLDDMMTHEDEDMQADPYEGMPSILGTGFWG